VLHRLPAGVDRVRFAAVCTKWRTAARLASLPPPLPLLALPDGTARSLPGGEPFPFPRCAGYAGACGGCLVFSRDDCAATQQLVVADPFSGATTTLPAAAPSSVRVRRRASVDDDDDPSLAGAEIVQEGAKDEVAVRKVICCSPRLVAAHVRLGDHRVGIAVCQPGAAAAASRWSVHADERVSGFDDYALYQGKLYAADYPGGGLFSIDIDHDGAGGDPRVSRIQEVIGVATTTDDTTFRGGDYLGEMLYLVESCDGGLLLVRRIINGRWVSRNADEVQDAARRNEFQVFKADFERSRWTEATTIGDDQVLFLRQRCSKSVRVSQCDDMPGDRIFFMENVDEDQTWYGKESPSCCSVYDMRKRCGAMALPVEVSWSPGTAATWLFPKDSTAAAVAVVEG
jgi:hypothetical protein